MEFVEWMDKQSLGIKALLSIFYLDLTWIIYRIIKASKNNDSLKMVIWILIAIFAGYIWWIVDLIFILVQGKVLEF